MARFGLKNIIGKNKPFGSVVIQLVEAAGANLSVEDENGNLLIGQKQPSPAFSCDLVAEDSVVGRVEGDEKSAVFASLLQQLLDKEAEKRRLGNEVLNLYQEINVIFNFSEKLSQAIDPEVIAGYTLDQAINTLAPDSGVVVLWDEEAGEMEVPAIAGEPLFNVDALRQSMPLLLHIGLSGQSAIFNNLDQLKEKGIISHEVQSLVYAAMKVKHRIMGALILAARNPDRFSAGDLKLMVTLALQSSSAIESAMLYEKNIREAREREEAILRIHEVTKKFVPNEFIRALGKEVLTDIKLGDQAEKIVTVLFTDIRDFTTLSEGMTPDENFRFVSSFNARLGPIIRANHGFINQYLGDSIMAIFPESADDALSAAIAMQRSIEDLNVERKEAGLYPIHAGIGMHTGYLIMGITGDEQRLDAATISDTVNTAARLESLTKYYRSPLLLSGQTYSNLQHRSNFHFRQLGAVRLKGKQNLLNVVECIDGQPPEDFEKKLATLSDFDAALNAYHERDFRQAIVGFSRVLALNSDDHTAEYFLKNALNYHEQGVPQNWTGAEEMLHK